MRPILSDTFLMCNCGSGPENDHETALDLVSGADVRCILHDLSSPTRWNGSRGQVRRPKSKIKITVFITYSERS